MKNPRFFRGEKEMTFGKALDLINNKDKFLAMRLPQWKEDVKIMVQFPDEHSKMTAPYLYVESRFGCVPWIPTQIELLSENWEVINV